MNDLQTSNLGIAGINSPGYGPRPGTPEHSEAEEWTKKYWENLFKGRVTNKSGINTRVVSNG